MSAIVFRVHGTPAPQGSKRHVGRGIMIESSKKVKPWREAVKFAAIEAQREVLLLDCPLEVQLHFTLPRPASKTRKEIAKGPYCKPDLDKLVRSTLDGLVDSGCIADDARVVRLHASKSYTDDAEIVPGCTIIVEWSEGYQVSRAARRTAQGD